MKLLVYLFFLFLSLGQLQRISLFNNQINFYLFELFLVIFCLVLFFRYKKDVLNNLLDKYKSVLFFLLILLISLIIDFNNYSVFQNFVGILYLIRLMLYFVYLFSLDYWLNKDKKNINDFKKGIDIFIFLTIISTSIQYFLYPNLRNLIYLGWDPHYYRTFGVFFDTSIAATIYGLIFFISNNWFIKIIYLIFLILSYSRNIYTGFLFSILYLFFQYKKNFFNYFLILLVFFLGLILIPKPIGEGGKITRTYTILARIEDFKKGINLFLEKPFFGYGYNRIRYIKNEIDSHAGASFSSSYLTILVSSGIFGLLSFFFVLFDFWKKFSNKRYLIMFVYLISLFDNILLHPFVLLIFFSSLFDKKL